MTEIFISSILAILFSLYWAPAIFVYTISLSGLLGSLLFSLSVNSVRRLREEDNSLMKKLSVKLNKDNNIGLILLEIYSLIILQGLNILFLRDTLFLLLFGFGSLLSMKKLLYYLEETYYDEITLAIQYLNNKKDKE